MRAKPVVLVIDDDSLFRKTLEAVFPSLGLNIKTTALAEQFMEYSEKLDPDLHIIDLQLTDITGFDLIRNLRKASPKAVIIVISGATDQENVTHALELGANDYILKPLERSLLASKLSRYVITDSIKEHLTEYVEPPKGRSLAKLTFNVEISEVDEIGVTLVSRHLIPKGTPLKLNTALFKEIGSPLQDLLMIVASNSFNSDTGLYSTYVEFEDIPLEFTTSLRQWIQRQASRKAGSQNS